jgi:hypothetical protein
MRLAAICRNVALIIAITSAASAQCQDLQPQNAAANSESERRGTHLWIERPWELRYVLKVLGTQSWESSQRVARKVNRKPGQISLNWEEIFSPSSVVPMEPPDQFEKSLSVVAIVFDTQGFVTTINAGNTPLRGRLNRLRYITLSTGEGSRDKQFDLGNWFLGLGDISTDWAPSLCGTHEVPSPFSKSDEGYRYGPNYRYQAMYGTFGCREWAFQMNDFKRPYIDVTSYVPTDKVFTKGAYIREFTGWARFDDKKPVIGKHEDRWYCLHDCPNGEQPGAIANIATWASKNGWQVPQRPTRTPMFPDPPGKIGRYPE